MAEYIEREALLSHQYNASRSHEPQLAEMVVDVRDIEDAPAADVVLVRYGRWIRYEDTQEHTVKYICPYCFDYTAFREDPGYYTVRGNYIYCRKCGAKMDGGNEDNG